MENFFSLDSATPVSGLQTAHSNTSFQPLLSHTSNTSVALSLDRKPFQNKELLLKFEIIPAFAEAFFQNAIRSRLEVKKTPRTIGGVVFGDVQLLSGKGSEAYARSMLLGLGSLMVSVLLGLVLWVAALQNVGLQRSTIRRNSFTAGHNLSNAIAEKTSYTFKIDYGRPSLDEAFKTDSNLISFPVLLSAVRQQDRSEVNDLALLAVNNEKRDAGLLRLNDSSEQENDVLVLKPFRPSPVDDVMSNATKGPVYKRIRQIYKISQRYKPQPHMKTQIDDFHQKFRRHPQQKTGRYQKTQKIVSLTDGNVFLPWKTYEFLTHPWSKKHDEYTLVVTERESNHLFYSQNVTRTDNVVFEKQKKVGQWKSSASVSNKTDVTGPGSAGSDTVLAIKDTLKQPTTMQPLRITTFRSNRKHNFMDLSKINPYDVAIYFPNLFQPVNTYAEKTT